MLENGSQTSSRALVLCAEIRQAIRGRPAIAAEDGDRGVALAAEDGGTGSSMPPLSKLQNELALLLQGTFIRILSRLDI